MPSINPDYTPQDYLRRVYFGVTPEDSNEEETEPELEYIECTNKKVEIYIEVK